MKIINDTRAAPAVIKPTRTMDANKNTKLADNMQSHFVFTIIWGGMFVLDVYIVFKH